MHKRGRLFYGDSGTVLSQQARDEIERNDGAGHPGNNVDFSQRYAQSEANNDDNESIRRMLKQFYPWGFWYPGSERFPAYRHIWDDPESEERLRAILEADAQHEKPPEESQEKPFSSDEFWSDKEEQRRVAKLVRPPKL